MVAVCVCVLQEHLVGSLALTDHLRACHHTYHLPSVLCVYGFVCFILLFVCVYCNDLCLCVYACVCACVFVCLYACVCVLPSLALADHLQVCHRDHHLSSDPARNSLSLLYLSIFKSFQDILAEIWGRRVGDPQFVG